MKKAAPKKKNSLRVFFIFCGVVLILIISSLTIKLVQSMSKSVYDPKYNFVLAFRSPQAIMVYGLLPQKKEITVIRINTKEKSVSPGKDLGIATDVFIPMSSAGDEDTRLSEMLPSLFARQTILSWYDVARMILVVNGMTQSEKSTDVITFDPNKEYVFDTEFVDEYVSQEEISIGIVNATGEVGVGRRLEKVITSFGGTVVSVTTAADIASSSKIVYMTEDTYTLKKVERLLRYPLTKATTQNVSDILIILGKDALSSQAF